MKTIKWPPLCTVNRRVVYIEGFLPLFVPMGDLCVCPWFGLADILANYALLGTSFSNCCVQGIFPSERISVPSYSRPVLIILKQKRLKFKAAETNVHTIADRDTPKKEPYWCCLTRQVTIPAYSQASVLDSCNGTGLMSIKSHRNVVERRCCMTA